MKDLLKNQKFISLYLAWILIHMTLLLSSNIDEESKEYFWPIADKGYSKVYDISEWFFYLAAPLVIIYLIKTFKNNV